MYTLLSHAGSDSWRIGDAAKDHWNTKRPWQVDTRVKLLIDPITSPAYPSGHTTTNAVWASVLSDLFPAKKAALFKRANEIGQNRVKAGVHFPHDVEGGKKLAAMIAAEMKKSPEYQRELAAAKAELKSPVIAAKPAVQLGRNCQTSTHTSGGMVLQACN
jgi:acid phosphatase (class A)